MKNILQKEEKVLRLVAKKVPVSEIKTAKTIRILQEMSAALKSQSDGVAIAAPQIGYSLRIFLVSGKVFQSDFLIERENSERNNQKEIAQTAPDRVFINPKIEKLSREKDWLPEGCLSVRPLFGKILRSQKATVTAYDAEGKKFTLGGPGLLAQIFQHETDHLDGILFIDKAKDIEAEKPR
jgi:peptide deformylase